MAQVTNESADEVGVQLFGLVFAPGETKEVPDDQAAMLGRPLAVRPPEKPPTGPVPPANPPAPPSQPPADTDPLAVAQADLAKAQAEVAAAEAAQKPAVPAGGNAQ